MYLYVHSSPTEHFPDNSVVDFSVQLPRVLTGNWKLGVVEASLPFLPKNPLFLCSDLCTESIVNEQHLPVLCQISKKVFTPSNISYIPTRATQFHILRVYICDKAGVIQKPSGGGQVTVTIHLLKDEAEEVEARY